MFEKDSREPQDINIQFGETKVILSIDDPEGFVYNRIGGVSETERIKFGVNIANELFGSSSSNRTGRWYPLPEYGFMKEQFEGYEGLKAGYQMFKWEKMDCWMIIIRLRSSLTNTVTKALNEFDM